MRPKNAIGLACVSLMIGQSLSMAAFAETVARANGRCLLKQDGNEIFNGYCTVKQKQNDGNMAFVVDLDNGTHFRFSGPNRQQLHVETATGISTNVLFEDSGTKGVFSWNDGRSTQRLAVKTDVATNPNAQFDDHHSSSAGAALAGAAVGALIGALLGGGGRSQGSGGQVGQPVPELQSLIGADPGYVESRLTGAGYGYVRTTPSENGMNSYWRRGSSCVDVRSVLNRYQSFTYANPGSCS